MNRELWAKFPIFLAIFFCIYAYGLIANSLDTHHRLEEKEASRVIAENALRAATLGDYLTEHRRFVMELARGPEVSNYLTNRALGMSLRYGLQSNLDAIEEAFHLALIERHVGNQPLYSRFVFIDESGTRLLDTDDQSTAPIPASFSVEPRLSIDTNLALARIEAPVSYRGTNAGHLIVWCNLGRLLDFLLPAPEAAYNREIVLTSEGQEVPPSATWPSIPPPLLKQILNMPDDKIGKTQETPKTESAIFVRHAVPDMPLLLVTIRPKAVVYNGHNSDAYLIIAGVFPPLMLLASLLFERMRRRNAQVALALQASRLRLMEISDNLVEGIALVGRNERLLFVNQRALRVMGQETEDAANLIGGPLTRLLRLRENQPARPPWLDVIEQGTTFIDEDATFLSPSGQEVSVAYGCSPLIDPEHGPAAIISFRDISVFKQERQEAMQSARLVSIGQLAAGIAHEINTPAQYISDNLGYIEDGLQTICAVINAVPNRAELLATMDKKVSEKTLAGLLLEMPQAVVESREGVAQIARIVLSMKEFSHPGSTALTATNINHALENTLTVSHNAWKHFAEIERDFDPTLPPVMCHAGEINQVFLNLILNAAQAIESSGKPLPGQIVITTRRDGEYVEIRVTDSGTGVPTAIRERIFDPFFTTKQVGKGTGQGLAICRDVVVIKHGGTLTVDGAEGEGAVFTIRLPIDATLSSET